MPRKILIVDDDKDIQYLVRYNFEKEGFKILASGRGEDALDKIRAEQPDLVILDLMLPGMDGLEVCRMLKGDSRTKAIPIVMLTAKGEETDIVVGLGVGADDYVSKPFSPKVLVARAKALLRRGEDRDFESPRIQVGSLTIDREKGEVRLGTKPVHLTVTEFNMLSCLARRPGKVFSRDELLSQAWTDETVVVDRTVDVHMVSLRKKLGKYADWIETVRGFGYRLSEEAIAHEKS